MAPTHSTTGAASARRVTPILVVLGAALPALLVYLRTLSPTIGAFDAGDLATASATLGIAHPPGYPLYTLLGHLAVRLVPFGDPAFRLNLLSALAAAAACGAFAALAWRLTGDALAALCAGWLIAFSRTWWSQSVITEVYAINGLLFALVWLSLVTWATRRDARMLCVAAYLFGLGLAHHLTIGLCAPAIAAYLALEARRGAPWRWSWLPLLAALLALGPLLYAYVFVRAGQEPAYAFGNPSTWPRFVYHVRGELYASRLVHPSAGMWTHRFVTSAPVMVRELGWPGVAAAVAGLALLARRRAAFAAACALVVLAFAAFTASYRIEDIAAYYMPAAAMLAVAASVAIAGLRRALTARLGDVAAPRLATAVAACALPLLLLVANWSANDMHRAWWTRRWLEALLDTVSRGGTRAATLLVDGDSDTFGLAYLTLVEHLHPEVRVIDEEGKVLDDIYDARGLRGGRSVFTITDEDRRDAELRLIHASRQPVFYDPVPYYALPGFAFAQYGLVHAVVGPGVPAVPDDGDAWRFASSLDVAPPHGALDAESRQALARVQVLRGSDAERRGDRRAAEQAWSRAEALAADVPEIRSLLAECYLGVGDARRALAQAQSVVRALPDFGLGYATLGNVHLRLGDSTAAVAAYERADALDGSLDAAQCLALGVWLRAHGQADRAIDVLEEAVAMESGDAASWAALGDAWATRGDSTRALGSYQRAAQADPTFAEARAAYGGMLARHGHYAAALAELRAARQLAPSWTAPVLLLATTAEAQGDFAAARAAYRDLQRLTPRDPHLCVALAKLCEREGDLAGAARELDAGITADPRNTLALAERAVLAVRRGDVPDAAADWRRILAVDPADAHAAYNLAIYQARSGRRAEAATLLDNVLRRLPPTDPDAGRLRAIREKLG